jgi:hypothetical protein
MMPSSSLMIGPEPRQWRRALALSMLFHLSVTAMLAMSLQRWPRGAADRFDSSAGLVLNRVSAQAAPYEGEEAFVASTPAADTDLLDALPNPSAAADLAADLPQMRTLEASESDAGSAQNRNNSANGGQKAATAGRGTDRSGRSGLFGASRAQVSVFGVEGTGTKFVYLFDRSSSMEGVRLRSAKKQLIESLQSLESVHQFQIIFFNSQPFPIDITDRGRMAFADDQNKRLAERFIGNVTADLGTDRYAALKTALAYNPDVIFFLTDADGPMSLSELADVERTNGRVNASICVIEFGDGAAPTGDNFLMRLAQQSGGQYGYVDTATLSDD